MCFYFRLILRILSVWVLRRNVPRDEIGCGKLDKINTREEKRLLQDERDVMKKKRKKRQRNIVFRFVRIVWRKHVLKSFQNVNF